MDQRLNKILSKAAPDILAAKLLDTGGEKKQKARVRRRPACEAKERADGDKPRSAKLNAKRSLYRLSRTQLLAVPKKLVTPYVNKSTQPFVAGAAVKSHNIGIRLQQLDKAKRGFSEPLSRPVLRRAKSIFSQPKPKNAGCKGWIESQEDKMDWTKKIKEMFVGLHNEFAALIDTQANLKKADDDDDIRFQLSEVERKLEEKEVQIHVAVKLYDENQKLKEEVAWLRKNIRPGRRKKKPYHPKYSTDHTPVMT